MKFFTVFSSILVGLSVVQLVESCGSRLTLRMSPLHTKPLQRTETNATKIDLRIVHQQEDDHLFNFARIVKDGILRGLKACQKLFSNGVRTCPVKMYKMLPIFGNSTFQYATGQTAFLHAISAAAITHEITHQCTLDNIPGCGCSSLPAEIKRSFDTWIIDGCGDNIEFGAKVARLFIDKWQKGSHDARTAAHMHNYRVGIEIFRASSMLKGRCVRAGFNCYRRVMWKVLAPFEVVASKLKEKYHESAQGWLINNTRKERYGNQLRPVSPRDLKLVYLDYLPPSCVRNDSLGVPGMLGRSCRIDESDDKCELFSVFCNHCKLSTKTVEHYQKVKCRCKFKWCCKVECDTCTERLYSEVKCTL